MPPVSKPLAALFTEVGGGLSPSSWKFLDCSVLNPISPRRYQPPNSTGGGGGMSGMSAACTAGMVTMTAAPASASFLRLPMTKSLLTGGTDARLPAMLNQRDHDGRKSLNGT